MILSMKWLKDYVNADMPIKEFVDGMTMSGSKVEAYEIQGEKIKNIVVGKVVDIKKHEDSDRLWICQIDVGKGENIQILTAAQNVFKGAIVPVALHKSTLADGTKITKGKLRGEVSNGMLCSFEELGMTQEDFPYAIKDGILILNEDPDIEKMSLGMDIREAVGFNDTCVEFEITSNRPDCLSVIGLAREVSATFDAPVSIKEPEYMGVGSSAKEYIDVEIHNKNLCSRYIGAVVKNVRIAPSPRWLAQRLIASGIRPINNFVDITNYVMLEYGQPMHAFDLRYVKGNKINIRNAKKGEEITILDGSVIKLEPEYLVIADEESPVAIAGIMGGEYSGIMDDTQTVVFEAASFDKTSVRTTAVKINKRTDASSRFEKGLDPANAEKAMKRALQLVEELGCGEVVSEVIDKNYSESKINRLAFDYQAINKFLGVDISKKEQVEYLSRLEIVYNESDDTLTIPSFRSDIEQQCDIAEEVARIYGYNKIPSTMPALFTQSKKLPEFKLKEQISEVLRANGAYEVSTYSFISPKAYDKIRLDESERESVKILNPFGEDSSVMRRSVIPSMLDVISKNCNSRVMNGRFYEVAREFIPTDDELPKEKDIFCIGYFGADEDFYSLKASVNSVLNSLYIDEAEYFTNKDNKTFHTGRCADIVVDNDAIGTMGEIHPLVAESFGISQRTYIAVLDLEKLLKYKGTQRIYKPLPKYPAVTRDLSLVCDEEITSGEIIKIIKENADYLENVELFDIFRSEKIGENKKSVSYSLILRSDEGTLTDIQADESVSKVLKALEKMNIHLRAF